MNEMHEDRRSDERLTRPATPEEKEADRDEIERKERKRERRREQRILAGRSPR